MPFIARQESFICEHCGLTVEPLVHGTYRNHCPSCLYSKHVDEKGPGDRASTCGGLMKPIAVDSRSGKGWILVHECEKCGKISRNKVAQDDAIDQLSQISSDSMN